MITPEEKSQRMRLAAHKSWARTRDRSARTEAARTASHRTRFVEKARRENPDATEQQIEQIAESLRRAFYTELGLRSAQARRIAKQMKGRQSRKPRAAEQPDAIGA